MFVKAALLYSAMTVAAVSVSDSRNSKLPADDNRSRSSSEDSISLVNQSIGHVSLASIQEEESLDGKVRDDRGINISTSSPTNQELVSPGLYSP